MNKQILRLALPNIVTNITIPLLGMVDLAIVGHIGNAAHIGGIAIGGMIFNLIYWNFSFLRYGTGGLTAQAYGAGNLDEGLRTLVRGLAIALAGAVLLLLLQVPVGRLAALVVDATPEVIRLALTYFYVRIWAAPAVLALYVFNGWFIGMQNAKIPMVLAIVINCINIVFSMLFVLVWHQGIAGVALGTVLAQYVGLGLAVFFWFWKYGDLKNKLEIRESLQWAALKRFFKINGDIFLRTFCLVLVFTFIPAVSASMGDELLAVNTLLMQLFMLFSYFMDGFAYAAEALSGKFVGARQRGNLELLIRCLLRWGAVLALACVVIYFFCGQRILWLLTDVPSVIEAAVPYLPWAVGVPVCGFMAFLFDGVYIGATATRSMRNIMVVATALFFALYYSLTYFFGNHGLWGAFAAFLLCRSFIMLHHHKKIVSLQS